MLGSLSEADDAVQEAWLRLAGPTRARSRTCGGWLTTVVARVCLNMLRVAQVAPRGAARRAACPTRSSSREDGTDPEHEALLADSVGLALLVVLETLTPAERLAFVLHDMFARAVRRDRADRRPLPGRGPAARQPGPPPGAAAARRRPTPTSTAQREVVDAFFAAAREGDFDALVAVLDPDVVLRADGGAPARRRPC